MTAQLQSQVVVPFAPNAGGVGSIQLSIEGDPGVYGDVDIHLLLTPDVNATVRTNAGAVNLGGSKVIDVPGGVVQFSGSDTASLPKLPTGSTPDFSTLFAFDSQGNEIQAGIWYDSAAGLIRSNRTFTGAVAYSAYKAGARILTYTPQSETLAAGARTVYGVIAAYYQGNLIVYPVQPATIVNGISMPEFYRIFSYKVITPEGEFEAPPNYPASGSYPDKSLVIDTTTGIKVERAHEVGYLDEMGRVFVNTPNVLILEPYVGDGAYKPKKFNRVATLDADKYSKDVIAKAQDFIRSKGLGKT